MKKFSLTDHREILKVLITARQVITSKQIIVQPYIPNKIVLQYP